MPEFVALKLPLDAMGIWAARSSRAGLELRCWRELRAGLRSVPGCRALVGPALCRKAPWQCVFYRG